MKNSILFLLFFVSSYTFSQVEKPKNYRRFDDKLLHFGFMLGINRANFSLSPEAYNYENYGLKQLNAIAKTGGQVGIVTSLKLGTPILRLRFVPSLAFQERLIEYKYINPDPNAKIDKLNEERVNSTNLEFPLMLQFRTLRLNNFAAYVLGGAQYTYDLQTQAKASQNFNNPFIKIKQDDLQGQVGAGLEWWAAYFKFGFEVKLSKGYNNVLIQDNTLSSKPINRLSNNVLWISIVFEG